MVEVALDYAQVEDTVPTDGEVEDKDRTAAEQEARAPAAKADTETHKRRLFVARDRWTKAACSFLVQCKGTGDPTIVDKVARWIDALGYRKVVLKTEGEPALVGRSKSTHARDNVQESSGR